MMRKAHEHLEIKFGRWMGYEPEQMVACSSGTAALHLALEAMNYRHKSILIPNYTMIACARAAVMADAYPIWVDYRPDLLMNETFIPCLAIKNTKGIMAVHIYGRRCNMDAIHQLASPRGLQVIEDMAEIHGVKPHPATDAACWSFYKNKIVAGEEGGIVAFRNPDHAKIARELRCLGFTDSHNFVHRPRGCNYRLANILAGLIIESLSQVKTNLDRRREIEKLYYNKIPNQYWMPPRDVCWVFDVRVPAKDRKRVVAELNKQDIQARVGFTPMTQQPEFREDSIDLHSMISEVMYLPVHPNMTPIDVQRITKAFLALL